MRVELGRIWDSWSIRACVPNKLGYPLSVGLLGGVLSCNSVRDCYSQQTVKDSASQFARRLAWNKEISNRLKI